MKEATDNKLGDAIYNAREARKLSTVQLAKLVGVHQSTLARIQLGENRAPAPQLLQRIAEALDLDVGDLNAMAGYVSLNEIPDLEGWLNVKYRNLPDQSVKALKSHLDYLVDQNNKAQSS